MSSLVKVALLAQAASEDLGSFNERVNEALDRLGDSVTDIRIAANIHEARIAERVSMASLLHTVAIIYEDKKS